MYSQFEKGFEDIHEPVEMRFPLFIGFMIRNEKGMSRKHRRIVRRVAKELFKATGVKERVNTIRFIGQEIHQIDTTYSNYRRVIGDKRSMIRVFVLQRPINPSKLDFVKFSFGGKVVYFRRHGIEPLV